MKNKYLFKKKNIVESGFIIGNMTEDIEEIKYEYLEEKDALKIKNLKLFLERGLNTIFSPIVSMYLSLRTFPFPKFYYDYAMEIIIELTQDKNDEFINLVNNLKNKKHVSKS